MARPTLGLLCCGLVLACLAVGCGATDLPVATIEPTAFDGGVLRYTCGGPERAFDPVVLEVPGHAEDGTDEVAAALRQRVGVGGPQSYLPDAGYVLNVRTATSAEFLNRTGPKDLLDVIMTNTGGGWMITAEGPCRRPELVYPDALGPATWVVDPAGPAIKAESTRVVLLVTEQSCASGKEPGDRLVGPAEIDRADAILLIFATRPSGYATCQANPSTSVTVDLRRPLGGRALVDPTFLFANDD